MRTLLSNAAPSAWVLLAVLVAAVAPGSFSASGTFIKIDVPGAGNSAGEGTSPQAINRFGEITGNFADDYGVLHGFFRHKDGTIDKFEALGASTNGGEGTFPQSINDNGEVAGYFQTSPGSVRHSFVRHRDGSITPFDPPASIGTVAQSISTSGEITGNYVADDVAHGFVRGKDGAITTIDPPGSANVAPMSINAQGEIAGYFADGTELRHGFLRRSDGTFVMFDPPGSNAGSAGAREQTATGTLPMSINALGEITGYFYAGPRGTLHGFMRRRDGTFAIFDPPGSIADGAVHRDESGYAVRPVTAPVSINANGEIAGYFADVQGVLHGFVRHRDARFQVFDAPDAGKATDLGTFPLGINQNGDVVGYYSDANSAFHLSQPLRSHPEFVGQAIGWETKSVKQSTVHKLRQKSCTRHPHDFS